MKRRLLGGLLTVTLIGCVCPSEASLVGPWFRYLCEDLGVQIPVANDWKVTAVSHGLVFAMQYAPHPYVRVAIGRIALNPGGLESLVAAHLRETHPADLRRRPCRIDGQNAVDLEGTSKEGPFRDLFIEKGNYIYWVGFSAENQDLWPQYAATFNIILDGLHFI